MDRTGAPPGGGSSHHTDVWEQELRGREVGRGGEGGEGGHLFGMIQGT